MAKNKDGLEAGADVTWEEMVAANLRRSQAPTIDLSREGIDGMKKADVIELLDAHGMEYDPKAPVGELRAALTGVMFLD